jgi:hypothetical protein
MSSREDVASRKLLELRVRKKQRRLKREGWRGMRFNKGLR